MNQKTKKKRQQRAQSRLALARSRQQQREQRQHTVAHRAEKQWSKTLGHLADLGATLNQHEERVDDRERTVYEVTFEGKNHQFGSRFGLQRWLTGERQRKVEEQMSWAERHVQWMIQIIVMITATPGRSGSLSPTTRGAARPSSCPESFCNITV